MRIVYVSVPVADGSSRRTDVIEAVISYLQDDERYVINDFLLGSQIIDDRYQELDIQKRNNRTTEDDIARLTEPPIIISFVNPASYGQGFAEGFTVGRKIFGNQNVRMLKLMHEDDWQEDTSKIAGNNVYSDLRIYKTPEEAVNFTREFMEKTQSPERGIEGAERK